MQLAIVVPERPAGFRNVMTFVRKVVPAEYIDVPRRDMTPGGRFEVRVNVESGEADELQARLIQQDRQVERI